MQLCHFQLSYMRQIKQISEKPNERRNIRSHFILEKVPRDCKPYSHKHVWPIGYDNIADFYVSMQCCMFYSTTKFQNISKYYKILLTNLQKCQHEETELLLSRKAFHFNVNAYIRRYRTHDDEIAFRSKKFFRSSL